MICGLEAGLRGASRIGVALTGSTPLTAPPATPTSPPTLARTLAMIRLICASTGCNTPPFARSRGQLFTLFALWNLFWFGEGC